jgi:hypothetical protein
MDISSPTSHNIAMYAIIGIVVVVLIVILVAVFTNSGSSGSNNNDTNNTTYQPANNKDTGDFHNKSFDNNTFEEIADQSETKNPNQPPVNVHINSNCKTCSQRLDGSNLSPFKIGVNNDGSGVVIELQSASFIPSDSQLSNLSLRNSRSDDLEPKTDNGSNIFGIKNMESGQIDSSDIFVASNNSFNNNDIMQTKQVSHNYGGSNTFVTPLGTEKSTLNITADTTSENSNPLDIKALGDSSTSVADTFNADSGDISSDIPMLASTQSNTSASPTTVRGPNKNVPNKNGPNKNVPNKNGPNKNGPNKPQPDSRASKINLPRNIPSLNKQTQQTKSESLGHIEDWSSDFSSITEKSEN